MAHQAVMVDPIKEGFKVYINHDLVTFFQVTLRLGDGLVG